MLGDDGFIAKLGIELGIGLFCKVMMPVVALSAGSQSQLDGRAIDPWTAAFSSLPL